MIMCTTPRACAHYTPKGIQEITVFTISLKTPNSYEGKHN